jgi:Domain of unknown function (DUF4296)
MKIALLIVTILLAGCSNHAVIPPDIMPKSKMEMVIWQMIQADEFFMNYVIKDSAKNTTAERTKLYQQVFTLNKITKEDFRKSYDFYIRRPEISRPMFDSLSARASRRRGEVYSKPYLQKDSLRTDSPRPDSSFKRRLFKLRKDTLQ